MEAIKFIVHDQVSVLKMILANPLSRRLSIFVSWPHSHRHEFIILIYCESSKFQSAV